MILLYLVFQICPLDIRSQSDGIGPSSRSNFRRLDRRIELSNQFSLSDVWVKSAPMALDLLIMIQGNRIITST
jgi:hypothetical protein